MDDLPNAPTHVFESPALYLRRLEVVERPSRQRGRLRSTTVKQWMQGSLLGLARRAPGPVTVGVLRGLAAIVKAAAALPGNQLRSSCDTLAGLAADRGLRRPGGATYRRFVDAACEVLESATWLVRGRREAMLARIHIPAASQIRELVDRHGGVMLCVPHNTGAVFASLKLAGISPTVLLAKNPKSVARTRTALSMYELLDAKVLMVRGGNPFALARSTLAALRDGQIVVCTVDRIHRDGDRVLVPWLGGVASLGPWAPRIAAKAGVPLIPTYAHSVRGGVHVACAEPRVAEDPDVLMRHYVRFLEAKVLEDPASWSFLGDRRWRWVLEDALAGSRRTDGGVRRPGRRARPLPPARALPPG